MGLLASKAIIGLIEGPSKRAIALDPVQYLPFEISSQIFMHCLSTRQEPGVLAAPMLLMNICNSWSNVALAAPALWASIYVELPRGDGFSALFATWLQRARYVPLSITLLGRAQDGISSVIRRHAEQIQDLWVWDLDLLAGVDSLSALKTLRIGDENAYHLPFELDDIIAVLCLAPNLVECTFDNYRYDETSADTLVLPFLKLLNLGECDTNYANYSYDAMLKCLTLPALETLQLPLIETDSADLVSFLQRSSPPLQRLSVRGTETNWTTDMGACFSLMPALTHLEFWQPDSAPGPADTFLAVFADPAQLSALRSVRFVSFVPQRAWYKALSICLLARRPQLAVCEVFWRSDFTWNLEMDADVQAVLRRLVADGVRIHVGTRGRNYL
ncbi:hypothetical protein B0H19DRAFT_132492 [Mycena capillaripes]|nr:hypothetical protein B0H19DRAFT_132492 [Mycena capillaripes]